jgi:hypothetical protein
MAMYYPRLLCLIIAASTLSAHGEGRYAFLVSGDPQYLAEKSATPKQLDPLSEQANDRFIRLIQKLPGTPLPKSMGGGTVSKNILGILITGDLIDSLDKRGGVHPAMQQFEWKRFKADYGLAGNDGRIPFPAYELHGNHDGPQGDTFLTQEIIARNLKRPGVVNRSTNGLHYSWNWGPIHCVNLGLFVGEGEERRPKYHYAPRGSLAFLKQDLAKHVADSGRLVVLSHHLHLNAPGFDWPSEDLAAYHQTIQPYNVVAIFNGHTHGSPPRRLVWNGQKIQPDRPTSIGIDSFDPDDSGAAKLHKGKPVGMNHGFLYVELIDEPGAKSDRFIVRSYASKDNWKTAQWIRMWSKTVKVPARAPKPIPEK